MAKFYGRLCSALDDLQAPLLLLMRLYWGISFVLAGKGKLLNVERTAGFFADLGIPLAKASAVLVGSVEFFGGLLLVLGLFSRLAALPLATIMIVAFATVHKASLTVLFQHPDVALKEEPFLFLLICLIVIAFGSGKFSLDSLLKKKIYEGPL